MIMLLVPGGTSHLKKKKNKRDCSKNSLKPCEQSLKLRKHKSGRGGEKVEIRAEEIKCIEIKINNELPSQTTTELARDPR